jgi:hypothetical protein
MRDIERQATDASLHRLGRHSVAIVNSIRTVGHDPITGKRADTEEPGSGCTLRWGAHYFVLTAAHVVEKAQPPDIRVFCPPPDMKFRSSSSLEPQDILDAVPLKDERAVIHRCAWEDLAILTTRADAVRNAEFFDALSEWRDPALGEELHCCGFPSDNCLTVDRKIVGNKEERAIALYTTVFSSNVLPLPTPDELKFKITDFDPDRHFLIPYDDAARGKHPRGISGAAMWWESDQKQTVWRPNFKFAGICTACYKRGSVVQVVKASVVRRFLEEVFGPGR